MVSHSWRHWSALLLVFCALVVAGCRSSSTVADDSETPPKQYNPKMATYAAGG